MGEKAFRNNYFKLRKNLSLKSVKTKILILKSYYLKTNLQESLKSTFILFFSPNSFQYRQTRR